MTQRSVFHLEPFDHFHARVLELNSLYDPEEDSANGSSRAKDPELRRSLQEIHAHFPSAPAAEQAAYLIWAFDGLRPLDKANHRTAWDYVAGMVEHADLHLLATEEEGRELGNIVWEAMENHLFVLDVQDDVYELLTDWFKHRIN